MLLSVADGVMATPVQERKIASMERKSVCVIPMNLMDCCSKFAG
jgi:hypothetical protein